ncbi:hypothetical protein BJ741DRAFT_588810 [Chytriomyces cf. hyalinus JEL632]|nr:hypothetical protein BJ741DRAFT_588810 [Chytriomyces cf. hyalinus JEL632]
MAATSVVTQVGCTSSTGASISIIMPQSGQSYATGDKIQVVWNILNPNPEFLNVTLAFSIANAANPNNVIALTNGALVTANPVKVSDGLLISTVPSVPAGAKYTVSARFKDIGPTSNWLQCFSPSFAIAVGSVVAPPTTGAVPAATSGVASVAPVTPVASKSSGAVQVLTGVFGVLASAVFLL